MSLEIKGGSGGITKLSELIIDADKNWGSKRITNLPEPANGTEPAVKAIIIESKPPSGKVKMDNCYIDPGVKEMVVESA